MDFQPLLAFVSYLGASCLLLAAFVLVYVRVTPYREFELIAKGNTAAAVALGGAILGYTFPLVSAIYYTRSIPEMALWAVVTCLVQLMVFTALRRLATQIENDNLAQAILLASAAMAVGLLNAVCISH